MPRLWPSGPGPPPGGTFRPAGAEQGTAASRRGLPRNRLDMPGGICRTIGTLLTLFRWQRRQAGLRPEQAGDVVQVDSMTTAHRGGRRTVKQLVAADPVSKWTCAKAYRRATARNAADFLDKVVRGMPFEAEAVQVDGGSEFKAEFELECRKRGIALRVLPPRSPKPNGNVERTADANNTKAAESADGECQKP